MSRDIIDGSIADSTTLNIFTFVNGNPISFVDPFGLSAERANNSTSDNSPGLMYEGNFYPIFIPSTGINNISDNWEIIDQNIYSGIDFSWAKLLASFQLDDFDENKAMLGNLAFPPVFSLFTGILNSANYSTNNMYIRIEYQRSGDTLRAVITVGSSDADKSFGQYAGKTTSIYQQSGNGKALATQFASSLYQSVTGEKINLLSIYDVEIYVDKAHRGSGDSSYLWIDSNGRVMETPIIYPDDKIQIGTRGFLGISFNPLVDLPLGKPIPINDKYQDIFNQVIDKGILQ